MKSSFILLVIYTSILLIFNSSCSSEADNEADAESTENTDLIEVTAEEFARADMRIDSLKTHTFKHKIRVNGQISLAPADRTDITLFYGGYITRINWLPGQKIQKGQVLFYLENPEFITMQQEFLEVKSQSAYLKSEFERKKTLFGDSIVSEREFLKAESDYQVNQVQYNALKKQLQTAGISPTGLKPENIRSVIAVRAPSAGYIEDPAVNTGSYLEAGKRALSIINPRKKYLELKVFEKDIPMLDIGSEVSFKLPDSEGETCRAKIVQIGHSIDKLQNSVTVYAEITKTDNTQQLVPGMYVEAGIVSQNEHSLFLPAEAVVGTNDNPYVLALKEKTDDTYRFKKIPVKTGVTENRRTQILDAGSLKEGDAVLTKGAFNIAD